MSNTVPNAAELQKSLNDYLVENSSVSVSGTIDPEENLLDTGILDSLGIAEITEFMEKEFGVEIDEEEISAKNYRSLKTLTDFCLAKLGRAAA